MYDHTVHSQVSNPALSADGSLLIAGLGAVRKSRQQMLRENPWGLSSQSKRDPSRFGISTLQILPAHVRLSSGLYLYSRLVYTEFLAYPL